MRERYFELDDDLPEIASPFPTPRRFEPIPEAPPQKSVLQWETNRTINFKTAAAFCGEYVPLSYNVEPIIRSASLYTLTAPTGAGKTAFNVVSELALVTGRADILGCEVTRGRVAYLACENPDDIRMRLMIACYLLNIHMADIGDRLVILDRREKPEDVLAELSRLAKIGPFALVIVDTLAAFFDGDNINDAVQGGAFMRRLRPITQIAGLPSVIVSAHPVKNAGVDALVPYGSGAILNEVDGNLTLWKKPESGIVMLHWQGKLRGLEFQSVPFRFEITGSPDILDAKGRQVQLPTLRPSTDAAAEHGEEAEADRTKTLLRAVIAEPGKPLRHYQDVTRIPKSSVERQLKKLAAEKLVEKIIDEWRPTEKGRKAMP